jgi:Glycosyltransferase family 87
MRLRAPALVLFLLAALLVAPPAALADSPWLVPRTIEPPTADTVPRGFELSSRQAVRIAERTPQVRMERARTPRLLRSVGFPLYIRDERYEIGYTRLDGDRVLELHIDGRSGEVLEVWTGHQVDWILARGYEPSVGGKTFNSFYVYLPLCLLFLLPFFDPKRPFRLLHLDLLMMLGFGLSQIFLNKGDLDLSVPLVYPFLVYLLVRLLYAGLRPGKAQGPLVPVMPLRILGLGLLLLVAFRIVLNVTDSSVIDVGFASIIGADRILAGEELYIFNEMHGDTYGPINYIAYIPFELLFPFEGGLTGHPAGHAAALFFDLMTMLGLFLLGRRLREGSEGVGLGVAFAFAWAAYPFSTYTLQSNTNDGLIAMLLVFALVVLRSAPARGAMLGLAASAKFAPITLAPLLAAGRGDRSLRSVLLFGAALVGVIALSAFAYLPEGGLRELYDTTIGFQLSRESPFSLWGLHPSLEPVRVVVMGLAAVLAVALFFVPAKRDLRQVAALTGALVIATQLTAIHWFYFYIVWFAPFALVALLGAHERVSPASGRIAGSTETVSA